MTLTKYKLTRAANGAEVILLPKMTIGRLDECELQLMASGASRRHAILTVENGQLWLEDLKSANGTYINEQRLEGKQQLKAGDHFRIDVEEFIIIDAAPPVEEVPVAKKVEATKAAVAPAEEKSNPGGTVPGAWASSDNAGGEEGRTAFIARKDLQGELESLGLADAKPIKVDVPTLLVHTGYHAGQRFELHLEKTRRAEWSVGSDSGRSIFLSDVCVSA